MDVKADTGLLSLITIAQYHQLPAEEPQIAHQFGVPAEVFTNTEIIRAAKSLGFKTRESKSSFENLVVQFFLPLPNQKAAIILF